MTSFDFVRKSMVAAALLVSAASAHAVSYAISNDQAGWLASVQGIGPTTFGTGTFVGVGCNPGAACDEVGLNGLPGVSFALSGPGSASFSNGLLNNLGVQNNDPDPPTIGMLTWTFDTPQNGWGGTFNMPTGNGLSFEALDLNLGWIDVTSVDLNQSLDGFLGFSSADRFSGVRVSTFSNPTGSSYVMTDVSIARAEVPEPTSLALLGLGLAGLGLARRRKA